METLNTQLIINRDDELVSIFHRIENQDSVLVISGVGGIGKTTLARSFVNKYGSNYDKVIWVKNYSENLKESILNDEQTLSDLSINTTGKSNEEVFENFLESVSSLSIKTLLIIDDIKEDSIPIILKLRDNPFLRILTTSRQYFDNLNTHHTVDLLSLEQASKLFYKFYDIERDNNLLKEILDAINFHTLTIVLLAKTGQQLNLKLKEIARKLKDEEHKLLSQENTNHTFGRIVGWLNEVEEIEKYILSLLLILPPKKYELLDIEYFFDKIKSNNQEKFDWSKNKRIIENLVSKGLLTESFEIHPLIRRLSLENYRPKISLHIHNTIESFKEIIIDLVGGDLLKEAIDKLVEFHKKLEEADKLKEIVMQSARLRDIEKQQNLGIISTENANLIKNQIRYAILDHISEIRMPPI